MAEKSVFISKSEYPFFEEVHVNIDWFGGGALGQKRKCQIGLHQNFLADYPKEKVLKISSSSLMSFGPKLSAVNLSKRIQKGIITVESAFQSFRIYSDGVKKVGPFPEYQFLTGRECKKLVQEAAKEMHSYQYEFDDLTFYAPAHHISQFYDFLYLNVLLELENKEVKEQLLQKGFTAFTDLATKSLDCQDRSATIFAGLVREGLIDEVRDYNSYLNLFRTQENGKAFGPEAYYAQNCGALTNRKETDNYLDLKGG